MRFGNRAVECACILLFTAEGLACLTDARLPQCGSGVAGACGRVLQPSCCLNVDTLEALTATWWRIGTKGTTTQNSFRLLFSSQYSSRQAPPTTAVAQEARNSQEHSSTRSRDRERDLVESVHEIGRRKARLIDRPKSIWRNPLPLRTVWRRCRRRWQNESACTGAGRAGRRHA